MSLVSLLLVKDVALDNKCQGGDSVVCQDVSALEEFYRVPAHLRGSFNVSTVSEMFD
jgi:hypothetical protein